jgi:hypothetical protein
MNRRTIPLLGNGTFRLSAKSIMPLVLLAGVTLITAPARGQGFLEVGFSGGLTISYGSTSLALPDTALPDTVLPDTVLPASNDTTTSVLYISGYVNDGLLYVPSSFQYNVGYTLLGDANLNGEVNGTDFSILSANFGQNVTDWQQGDSNYSGLVNGETSTGDLAALNTFAAANGLTVEVPEPVTCSLLLIAGAGIMMRPRRKQKAV